MKSKMDLAKQAIYVEQVLLKENGYLISPNFRYEILKTHIKFTSKFCNMGQLDRSIGIIGISDLINPRHLLSIPPQSLS